MKKNKSVLPYTRKALLLSVLFLLVLMSCKKDGELFPAFNNENLTIHFVDSFDIVTTLLKDDSIRTDIAGANLLGIHRDSIMGIAASSFYTELTLAGSNVNFGNNAVIDSVVLAMKYVGSTSFYGYVFAPKKHLGAPSFSGNILTPMSIEVYRLSDPLSKAEYYSNEDVSSSGYPTPLGLLTFTPLPQDSVQIIQNGDTIKQAPHVRVVLDNAFGQEILDAGKNGNVISTNSVFKNMVKGLHITTSKNVINTPLIKGDGAIVSFDMNASLSTVTIYYNNDLGSGKSYSFIINSESKKFNHFEHNYTSTEIDKQLNNLTHDSTLTYVQAMGGLKTKLMIPNLKNLSSEGKIVINKAEIIFNVSDVGANLATIKTLVLTGVNSSGQATFLVDYLDSPIIFGGTYDAPTKTYKFNIARHIQDLITNNSDDYGLYLMATSSSITANRSIINSFKHPSNKIKLNITYSKF